MIADSLIDKIIDDASKAFSEVLDNDERIDRSEEAQKEASNWMETDRQWIQIREIFRKHGKWIQ